MYINNYGRNASQTSFNARLKPTKIIDELLDDMNLEDKKEFNKALKVFANVATDDVVELRKTKENNFDVYSLVNEKNDKDNLLVCKIFQNISHKNDESQLYKRKTSENSYIAESLIDTFKEVVIEHSNAYHSLFGDKSKNGNRLKQYLI